MFVWLNWGMDMIIDSILTFYILIHHLNVTINVIMAGDEAVGIRLGVAMAKAILCHSIGYMPISDPIIGWKLVPLTW
ncbi:hypothetical protein KSS87_023687 [Heliosperma pusillum]|nr:hypothetical protein KSS87_023687 [Heliosperma pusillum]